MRFSANRIRSINRTLASIDGRSFYNDDKPLSLRAPDHSRDEVVFIPAPRL